MKYGFILPKPKVLLTKKKKFDAHQPNLVSKVKVSFERMHVYMNELGDGGEERMLSYQFCSYVDLCTLKRTILSKRSIAIVSMVNMIIQLNRVEMSVVITIKRC